MPRGGAEYGGDVFMSGREVRQAARFQNKFADELGHSRFVSLVVQHNEQGHIEPRAYQISDQGGIDYGRVHNGGDSLAKRC